MIRIVCSVLGIGVLTHLYLRCLTQTFNPSPRFQFRLIHLLIFVTAISLLGGAGFIGDSLVLALFIAYAIMVAPLWKKVVSRWSPSSGMAMLLTSVAIVSSFIAVLTVAAAIVFVVSPSAIRHFPMTLSRSATTGARFAFLYILGDNYRNEAQLVLYGLLFGIPLNIALGTVVGAVLGQVADSFLANADD